MKKKIQHRPGDLVSLRNSHEVPFFIVGSLDRNTGWEVPNGSAALIVNVVQEPDCWSEPNSKVEILINGKIGWVYPNECFPFEQKL